LKQNIIRTHVQGEYTYPTAYAFDEHSPRIARSAGNPQAAELLLVEAKDKAAPKEKKRSYGNNRSKNPTSGSWTQLRGCGDELFKYTR